MNGNLGLMVTTYISLVCLLRHEASMDYIYQVILKKSRRLVKYWYSQGGAIFLFCNHSYTCPPVFQFNEYIGTYHTVILIEIDFDYPFFENSRSSVRHSIAIRFVYRRSSRQFS